MKIFALILGPSGFGIISQLNNFILLFTQTVHIGTPVGITSEISKLSAIEAVENKIKMKSYFVYFNFVFGILTAFFSVIFFIFSGQISFLLVEDSSYYIVLAIAILAAPLVVIFYIIEAFLRSYEFIDIIVKISIINNIVSLIFLFPLIYYLKYIGIGIYLFIFGSLPFLIYFIFYRNIFDFKKYKVDKSFLKRKEIMNVLKIGVISLSSSLLHQGAIILLRKFAINNFGLIDNGVYQSVLSTSIAYFSIIYIFLSNYTLPLFSKIIIDSELVEEINNNFRFLLFLVLPIIVITFTYRGIIVELLYSKSFNKASTLFLPQLIGDFFRVFAALFGLWTIPRMKIKQMLIFDFLFNLSLFLFPHLYMEILGKNLIIIPVSYMTAFIIHFLLYFIYSKIYLKFYFKKQIIYNAIVSIFVMLLSVLLSYISNLLGYFSTAILLIIWIYLVLNKEEKKSIIAFFKH